MFTGLIGDVGTLESLEATDDGASLLIATALTSEIAIGDSVAVNGVCLTATSVEDSRFTADAVRQTLSVTTTGDRGAGDPLNLELAMRAGDRLGGHIVQGHVDGTAEVLAVTQEGIGRRIRIGLDPALWAYVVERGSVTLDGVSLTIAALDAGWLEVALIPETLERTTLGAIAPGNRVNVEVDVVAKYVERSVSPFLRKEGT